MDPWQDYLALPTAPLVLCGQFVALGFRERGRRVAFNFLGMLAIGLMLAIVSAASQPADANIGGGLLVFQLAVSLVLVIVAALRPTRS